jgi:hypothetical protein
MGFKITTPSTTSARQPQPKVMAREFLKQVAVNLIKDDGSVKSGYLRVSANDSWSAGHLGSGATKATTQILDQVQLAYGPEAKKVLQNYLENTSAKPGTAGKIGTQSFVALIQKMEEPKTSYAVGYLDSSSQKIFRAHLGDHRLDTTILAPLHTRHFEMPLSRFFSFQPPVADTSIPVEEALVATPDFPSLLNQVRASAFAIDGSASLISDALSNGHYADAAALMNAREPRLSPAQMARELVNDHYGGKAHPTRLVQFAVAAFNGAHRAEAVAEFLLEAFCTLHDTNDTKKAKDKKDMEVVRLLFDSLHLWQASGQNDIDHLGRILVKKVPERLPQINVAKTELLQLSQLHLADRIDFDHIESLMQKFDNPKDIITAVGKQVMERMQRLQYLTVSASPKLKTPILLPGQSIDLPLAERSLLLGCTMPAANVSKVGHSFLRNPAGDLRGAKFLTCVIRGTAGDVHFDGADLTGSELTFEVNPSNNGNMHSVTFVDARLDDADVRIDYAQLDQEVALDSAKGSAAIVQVMQHSDSASEKKGPLAAIASIPDRYAPMKIKLMREAIEFIEKHNLIAELAGSLSAVIDRNNIYANDPVTQRFFKSATE